MQPELHVHYSNGHVDNFCGTKIRTVSNLRRWALALLLNEGIESAILFYSAEDGVGGDAKIGL